MHMVCCSPIIHQRVYASETNRSITLESPEGIDSLKGKEQISNFLRWAWPGKNHDGYDTRNDLEVRKTYLSPITKGNSQSQILDSITQIMLPI